MAKRKKREAEENLGLFMTPDMGSGAGGFLIPSQSLKVGPGEPGPGDQWAFPKETTGAKSDRSPVLEPAKAPDSGKKLD